LLGFILICYALVLRERERERERELHRIEDGFSKGGHGVGGGRQFGPDPVNTNIIYICFSTDRIDLPENTFANH